VVRLFRTAAHFAPKAKRVVQIFCCGGVSHIDTFDYKPELERFHGRLSKARARTWDFSVSREGDEERL